MPVEANFYWDKKRANTCSCATQAYWDNHYTWKRENKRLSVYHACLLRQLSSYERFFVYHTCLLRQPLYLDKEGTNACLLKQLSHPDKKRMNACPLYHACLLRKSQYSGKRRKKTLNVRRFLSHKILHILPTPPPYWWADLYRQHCQWKLLPMTSIIDSNLRGICRILIETFYPEYDI